MRPHPKRNVDPQQGALRLDVQTLHLERGQSAVLRVQNRQGCCFAGAALDLVRRHRGHTIECSVLAQEPKPPLRFHWTSLDWTTRGLE